MIAVAADVVTLDGEEPDEVAELKKEVKALQESVDGLLNLWQQSLGILKFIKWSASLGAASAAIYAVFKGH